ncbi:MAG: PadR family transcriptional regulator [Firmicutes bacterium]|nr:PadR family transcriptional regulator [Bacillota bacterium]
MYELFVLGELCDKPMHGYWLHHVLSQMLPLRPVSWGSLYPVLQRLEEQGAIEIVPDSSDSGRPRKIYRLTAMGRRRFLALMMEPIAPSPDADEIFRIKLSKFHLLEPADRVAVARQYFEVLEMIAESLAETQARVANEPNIGDRERSQIMTVISYEKAMSDARLKWMDHYIRTLDGEE